MLKEFNHVRSDEGQSILEQAAERVRLHLTGHLPNGTYQLGEGWLVIDDASARIYGSDYTPETWRDLATDYSVQLPKSSLPESLLRKVGISSEDITIKLQAGDEVFLGQEIPHEHSRFSTKVPYRVLDVTYLGPKPIVVIAFDEKDGLFDRAGFRYDHFRIPEDKIEVKTPESAPLHTILAGYVNAP